MAETSWMPTLADYLPTLVVGVGAVLAFFALRRWYRRSIHRRRWLDAQAAEQDAPRLLAAHGFVVVGAQVQGTYTITIDAAPMVVPLRADYLVERDGRRYIAEVKSGKVAPQLRTAATRRQLLEYRIAFGVDGVLLVDGQAKRLHAVEFPFPSNPGEPRRTFHWMFAWTMVALAIAGLWLWAR